VKFFFYKSEKIREGGVQAVVGSSGWVAVDGKWYYSIASIKAVRMVVISWHGGGLHGSGERPEIGEIFGNFFGNFFLQKRGR
jgi:hypothetical protein